MARASKQDPPAIRKLTALRAQVLQLAVQGKLVEQDPVEGSASVLLERTRAERGGLAKAKRSKAPVQPATDPSEMPYGLPTQWEWARLGDVTPGGLQQGWSPTCERFASRSDDEWAVIKTTAIYGMEFEARENKALPLGFDPRPQIEIQPGDLLLTRKGPRVRAGVCCYVATVRPRLMICDTVFRFRVDETLAASRFVEIALNSPVLLAQIELCKTGASESGLSLKQGDLLGLSLPLPPRREQERIVAKVDQLLAAIDELESYLRRVETLRPLVLQLAVQGRVAPQVPSPQEPASALLDRLAAEREALVKAKKMKRPKPLPAIAQGEAPYVLPPGWQWARLGDVARLFRGVTYKKEQAQISRFPNSIALLRGHNIQRRIQTDDLAFVPAELVNEDQVLRRGDLVLTMSSGSPDHVGKMARFDGAGRFTFGAFCAVVRPSAESMPILELAFSAPYSRALLLGASRGIGINNLRTGDVEALPFPVAPLEEQHRIVARVSSLMALIDAVEAPGTNRAALTAESPAAI